MARKTKETESGEQMALIDVEPKNKGALLRVARRYKRAQDARIEARRLEKKEEGKLLEAVNEAKIIPDRDGAYTFRVGNVVITVTPRDELVHVSLPKEKADEEES